MITQSPEIPMVAFSVRVYHMLLSAYPTKFQQEYGSHMSQVFRDCCLRTFHQSGTNGMARLWAITILDLFRSLIEEHTRKETDMTRSKFIRLSGWAFMLGAVTFFLFPLGLFLENNVYDPFRRLSGLYDIGSGIAFFATPILLAIGMLGLRIRFGEDAGGFGKNILLIGAIGGLASEVLGIMTTWTTESGWVFLYTDPVVPFTCLALFGVVALRSKPLPRWNLLPLLAGGWFPILVFIVVTVGNKLEDSFASIGFAASTIQCIALVMLGFVLKSDVPEEMVAPA